MLTKMYLHRQFNKKRYNNVMFEFAMLTVVVKDSKEGNGSERAGGGEPVAI